ncbi:hypothetical protein DFH07DRAFT_779362 [Mycena maculata]|uniref:Uncharacterized protein n=1 Tax=Mycena maculata TaxID=230809 RepID=A0AAD7MY01_9AGAR|nr:hypothetical protein DFH07DRAFT_779362 [Mycena maculata]
MLSYKFVLSALSLFGAASAASGDDAHSAIIAEGHHTEPEMRASIPIIASVSNDVCACNVRATSVTLTNFQTNTCYRLKVVVDLLRDQGYSAPEWTLNSIGLPNFRTLYTSSGDCSGAATTLDQANAFKIDKI